nr:protein-export chaperone SecB [Alphaproteobacteria bacterium]
FPVTGPGETLQPFLWSECPRLLFPFPRNIIADATRDGGFPPLMLAPVDFAAMFQNQLAQQAAAEQGDTA